MTDRTDKCLLSSTDFGVGKTWTAAAYSIVQRKTTKPDLLFLDYERGADYYLAPSLDQIDPVEGKFFVTRVKTPTLYEVRAMIAKIAQPTTPTKNLQISRKPIDTTLLSPQIIAVLKKIHEGLLVIGGIVFDTVTRLCELVTQEVFGQYTPEKADKMSQLLWARSKDDISEMLYDVIELDFNMILTAWSKNKFDKNELRSTNELITDVLKNVRAFIDLEVMLEPNPRDRKTGLAVAPKGTILKSRIRRLPLGATINPFTWENFAKYQPQVEADRDNSNGVEHAGVASKA